jgi:hypothetical protein
MMRVAEHCTVRRSRQGPARERAGAQDDTEWQGRMLQWARQAPLMRRAHPVQPGDPISYQVPDEPPGG